jgi:hypothetical protein
MALSISHCFEEATIEYGSMRTMYRLPVAVEEQPKRTVSVRATDPRQTFVSVKTIFEKKGSQPRRKNINQATRKVDLTGLVSSSPSDSGLIFSRSDDWLA